MTTPSNTSSSTSKSNSTSSSITSKNCGQKALLPVLDPSPNKNSILNNLSDFALPSETLQSDERSLISDGTVGIEVLKVTKNGKLAPRRVVFSPNHRSLFVTTNKIMSLKSLVRSSEQAKGVLVIDISCIDHLIRGQLTSRFITATSNINNTSSSSSSGGDPYASAQVKKMEPTSLSIVYLSPNNGGQLESLDLIVPDAVNYGNLWNSLEQLMALQNEQERSLSTPLRLLQYHMVVGLGKRNPLTDHVSLQEFYILCDRLNTSYKAGIPKEKITALYKDLLKDLKKTHPSVSDLPLWAVAELLKDIEYLSKDASGIQYAKDDPLSKLWIDILGTDPVPTTTTTATSNTASSSSPTTKFGAGELESISLEQDYKVISDSTSVSSVAFLSYIRSTQKEFTKTLEYSNKIIYALDQQIATSEDLLHQSQKNQQEQQQQQQQQQHGDHNKQQQQHQGGDKLPSQEDYRLTKQKFVNYLMGESNDLMDPEKGKQDMDMTYPLSNYYISASHDTYLNCWNYHPAATEGQGTTAATTKTTTKVDAQMYFSALARGARCIELDVWDSPAPPLSKKEQKRQSSKSTSQLPHVQPLNRQHDPVPVICHTEPKVGGGGDGTMLDFSVVLKIVRQFALANPDGFPILLKIENHCSFPAQSKMAEQLSSILESCNLLAMPSSTQFASPHEILPSPDSMRGKILIIGKRPKYVREGARVVNDDYDAENEEFLDDLHTDTNGGIDNDQDLPHVKSRCEEEDYEIEESKNGIVIGFDAAGPVRSKNANASLTKHTPGELLWMAQSELDKVKLEAAEAELKALEKADEAKKTEKELDSLIAKSGLNKDKILELATKLNSIKESLDPDDHVYLLERQEEEGIEVQDFFGDAVEGAKLQFTKADSKAIEAAEKATAALQKLNEATAQVREAEKVVESVHDDQQKTVNQYQRAASNARAKQEDFDQMQERVEKLREMLGQVERSSISNDNVVSTAVTEAKISEKRASEVEARATRAASAASKDRAWAEEETHREEALEKDASNLHERMRSADSDAKSHRVKWDKAAQALDRINEQIKLIEQSSQYLREQDEMTGEEKKVNSPGKIMGKHAAKLEERRVISDQIKKHSQDLARAEEYRIGVAAEFEKKAVLWKEQTSVASKARRQADKSSLIAEELAEHAEEEREAANLRHIAREKAQSNVSAKEDYSESLRTQLEEAQKQAKAAKIVSDQARIDASRLTHLNDNVNAQEELVKTLGQKQAIRERALRDYQIKEAHKKETEVEASDARRLFHTSESVYKAAMKNASKEEKTKNLQRHADRKVIVMFNAATLARKQAEHTLEQAKYAQYMVTEREVEVRRAKEYYDKTERISEIPESLVNMTYLHTTRYRYWQKSFGTRNSNMHSFATSVLDEMTEKTLKTRGRMKEFTRDHICRTFPSWTAARKKGGKLNADPIRQWAMGCQIVSLNMSTFDEHVLKADGWFRANGSCGYVLKPPTMRHIDALSERAEQWTINVLCGYYLPAPLLKKVGTHLNPYVKISVYNYDQDSAHYKTKVVANNGLNPVWNDEEGFEFRCNSPSMSLLLFTVWDKGENNNDGFIGACAMPISCIREGHRSVPLFDRNHTRSGPYAFASLLVRAQKRAG